MSFNLAGYSNFRAAIIHIISDVVEICLVLVLQLFSFSVPVPFVDFAFRNLKSFTYICEIS